MIRMARFSHRTLQAARYATSEECFCQRFQSLSVQSRALSSTAVHHATPTLHPTTTRDRSAQGKGSKLTNFDGSKAVQPPAYVDMTPAQRAARASERARARLQQQQQKFVSERKLGGLAKNSFFAVKEEPTTPSASNEEIARTLEPRSNLSRRTLDNMSLVLNPRPDARARWQRKMVIRLVRRRGRLNKATQIARTERSHLSKSEFFKTSMKKLAPLARQIAGKSIDEAILQMRFSKKKAAQEVRAHLVQAKDEAIVVKGMGLDSITPVPSDSSVVVDAGTAAPLSHQTPTKSSKSQHTKSPTDMYIAQAWVNRGPYGMEPEFRARGRVNILRPPWTGISVLLKEEKTRTREKADKEAKAIRKRTGRNMWVQLPDRPVTRQSQYVLW